MNRRKNLSPERKLRRVKGMRRHRARYLIVCEGTNTEPAYFKQHVRIKLRDGLVTIDVDDAQGDPLVLVKKAVNLKREAARKARLQNDDFLAFDAVWCVTDVDEHHNLSEARILAAKNGIYVAISNPCFEVWGALHFSDVPFDVRLAKLQDILALNMPGYDRKNKLFQLDRLVGRFTDAKRRAEALHKTHSRNGVPLDTNPSTDVYVLVQELIDEAKKVGDPGPDDCFGL